MFVVAQQNSQKVNTEHFYAYVYGFSAFVRLGSSIYLLELLLGFVLPN